MDPNSKGHIDALVVFAILGNGLVPGLLWPPCKLFFIWNSKNIFVKFESTLIH